MSSRFPPILRRPGGACAWACLMVILLPAAAPAQRTELGRPGYLVIEGVRDSTQGTIYLHETGPGPGRHALVWPEGTLSLPDTLSLEPFGAVDVGLVCRPVLSGVGNGGRLVFRDGIFAVSEPLVLSDGVLELHVAAGELEIRGEQIRYRRPRPQDKRSQANFVFLAGLVLLIVVLIRRVRRGTRPK